ncbi:hypothetical protein [Herpetosiphon gulosus]
MKLGAMLGSGYGLLAGLIFGLPVGFLIGLAAGFIGGFILALCIFAWRKWLNPYTFDERYIRWLAPLPLSTTYIVIAYHVNSFGDFGWYLKLLSRSVTEYSFLSIFVSWPCIIMSITLIIVIPSILFETQPT